MVDMENVARMLNRGDSFATDVVTWGFRLMPGDRLDRLEFVAQQLSDNASVVARVGLCDADPEGVAQSVFDAMATSLFAGYDPRGVTRDFRLFTGVSVEEVSSRAVVSLGNVLITQQKLWLGLNVTVLGTASGLNVSLFLR